MVITGSYVCLPYLLFFPLKRNYIYSPTCMWVCVCMGGHMPQCICECQRTCENWLSPFTMRILGTELRSSGSEADDLPVETPCCPFIIFLLCLWSHCPTQRLVGSQSTSGLGTWGQPRGRATNSMVPLGYLHGQRHQ